MNTLAQTPTKAHAWWVWLACLLLVGALVTNTQAYEWSSSSLDITPNTHISMVPPEWKSRSVETQMIQSQEATSQKPLCGELPPIETLLELPLTMQQAHCIIAQVDTLGIPETSSPEHYTGIRGEVAPYLATIESKKTLNIELNNQEKILLRAIATLSLG